MKVNRPSAVAAIFCSAACAAESTQLISTQLITQVPEKNVSVNDTENRNIITFQNTTKKAEESVEWLIAFLRSHIHESDFAAKQFETKEHLLRTQVAHLSLWISQVFPYNHVLLKKVTFARQMFSAMAAAVPYLNFYSTGGTAPRLVRNLVQLNVRLLKMYDSSGNADSQSESFRETVSGFSRILDSWAKMYSYLPKVPLSVRIVLEGEFIKAERTLEELKMEGDGSENTGSHRGNG